MPLFSSSGIDRFEYDPEAHILQIWFRGSTGSYKFLDVPQNVFDGLRQAGSVSASFEEHILAVVTVFAKLSTFQYDPPYGKQR